MTDDVLFYEEWETGEPKEWTLGTEFDARGNYGPMGEPRLYRVSRAWFARYRAAHAKYTVLVQEQRAMTPIKVERIMRLRVPA